MRKASGHNKKEGAVKKGAWSKQEDQKLVDYIRKHGQGCWRSLPRAAGLLRCGKSCRLRWMNYLRPDLKRGNFGDDEEDLIIKLHALLGNRWSLIAGRLPGRTDNEIKNYWNTHLRRKLIQRGIDPDNHRLGCHTAGPSNLPKWELVSHGDEEDQEADSVTVCSSEASGLSAPLPDLNLDLTIGLPFVSGNKFHAEQIQLGC
ncbi:hypothetical protein MLD38_031594 [Melastoma candidum]|uniref:Uncharacterized protein n=1 Tax=Melastoma candidum TaxID=119954 RepID=A0ACB9MQ64_9MYRT|nr:hypothetical protein MLD38_031594 [Melastoma candidum]